MWAWNKYKLHHHMMAERYKIGILRTERSTQAAATTTVQETKTVEVKLDKTNEQIVKMENYAMRVRPEKDFSKPSRFGSLCYNGWNSERCVEKKEFHIPHAHPSDGKAVKRLRAASINLRRWTSTTSFLFPFSLRIYLALKLKSP